MYALTVSSHSYLPLIQPRHLPFPIKTPQPFFFPNFNKKTLIFPIRSLFISKSSSDSSESNHLPSISVDDDDVTDVESEISIDSTEVELEVEKLDKNSRRIRSQIGIDANLETVWNLITDYERLADFIPGLAISELLEKGENYARVFQMGQQNLGFGLKFYAKGVVDCYEKELESTPFGQKRNIEFKMTEGDFQMFEGKWSIEETKIESHEGVQSAEQQFQTTLFYVVDVKPKIWLPIRLVEGRLCREVKTNLVAIREAAQKAFYSNLSTC